MSTTAFGASWDLPASNVVAVLRAQASAVLTLQPVTTLDASAATLAAHVWATVTGESTLRAAYRHGPAAVAVAAAVLARAAGHRTGPQVEGTPQVPSAAPGVDAVAGEELHGLLDDWDLDVCDLPPRVLSALSEGLDWVCSQGLGEDEVAAVLAAAACDLACAHTHPGAAVLLGAAQMLAGESSPCTTQ